MSLSPTDIPAFLAHEPSAIVAEVTAVKGSTPREAGTFMLIGAEETLGTIGGGQLEYLAIARARTVLAQGLPGDSLDIPLGPEIGQCCGGRVKIALRVVDDAEATRLRQRLQAEIDAHPDVYVFGAGHVGLALARALALLPLHTFVVDTRPDELQGFPDTVVTKAVALPEAVVRGARPGSAFVILTHDHALDFLIVEEALKRNDAAYIGMVGSLTKRAKFSSWYLGQGGDREALLRLTSPIGAEGLGDKRPEVIAALAAAEIMVHIGRREASGVRVQVAENMSGAPDGR